MDRLAQYLAANYANVGKPGDSPEDKAIAALRQMDEALGHKSRVIGELREALTEVVNWLQFNDSAANARGSASIDVICKAALAKAEASK